jgi:hypothetical protein
VGRGGVPVPKPEPKAREKARAQRTKATARQLCLAAVWKRSDKWCECTGCAHCNPSGQDPTGWPTPGEALDGKHPDDQRRIAITHGLSSVTYQCGTLLRPANTARTRREVGHVHEIVPRSLGGDATDPDNCLLLCPGCHFNGPSGAHRKTERVVDPGT